MCGGGAALKLSGVQLGSLMRFQGEVKVKGRNKEKLRKIELEKVKMEWGRGRNGGSPRQSS